MTTTVPLRAVVRTRAALGVTVQQVGKVSGAFVEAAQQGMFAIDTDSAREMILSIGEVREQLQDKLRTIDDLKTQARLGDLPEAQGLAKLDAEVAAGNDHQSLAYVLGRFVTALGEAHHALEIGMRNYEQVEAEAKHSFGRNEPS